MKRTLNLALFISSIILGFIACSDDDTPNPEQNGGKVLIETTVKNPDGSSGSSYIQLIPDFSNQSVDNKKAIQVGFDAGIKVVGNDVYIFPEFGKDGTQQLQKYTYSSGSQTLSASGSLALPPMSGAFNMVSASDEKAYIPQYNLGKILVFNPKTMAKTGEIDLTSYAYDDNNPDPAYSLIRDGLLYVPLDQVGSNWMPFPDYKQVDVAIIDVKTDKVLKVISEKNSKLTFPTRPFLENMIFMNEQKDIYIACVGGFGLDSRFPETGFVCIPNNETEFDTSASWDISQTTIEGTNYKPGSLSNCKYIGNGKVCGYISITELINDNPYSGKYLIAAVLDLNAKTIKKIDGIPMTDGHSIFIDTYKNLVVFGAYGEKEAGFFTYNPSTGEVSNGAVVTTVGNPVFMHSFE
jgi:hypothetical protein